MSHAVLTAAQVIRDSLNREGVLVSADPVDVIRNIAAFTVTDPSGHQFTVAVTAVSK